MAVECKSTHMVQNAFYCGSLGVIKHSLLKRLLDVVDDVGKEVPARPDAFSDHKVGFQIFRQLFKAKSIEEWMTTTINREDVLDIAALLLESGSFLIVHDLAATCRSNRSSWTSTLDGATCGTSSVSCSTQTASTSTSRCCFHVPTFARTARSARYLLVLTLIDPRSR